MAVRLVPAFPRDPTATAVGLILAAVPGGIGQQTLTGRVSLVVFAAVLAMVQPSG